MILSNIVEVLVPEALLLTVEGINGEVTLRWKHNSNTPATDFKIYRSASPFDLEALPSPLATVANNISSYNDTTVVNEAEYYYLVIADSMVSNEEYIEMISIDPPVGFIFNYSGSIVVPTNFVFTYA